MEVLVGVVIISINDHLKQQLIKKTDNNKKNSHVTITFTKIFTRRINWPQQ